MILVKKQEGVIFLILTNSSITKQPDYYNLTFSIMQRAYSSMNGN